MTYKDGPRTERNNIFIVAVDPLHRYSQEVKELTKTFYDYVKLKKTLWSPWFIQNVSAL